MYSHQRRTFSNLKVILLLFLTSTLLCTPGVSDCTIFSLLPSFQPVLVSGIHNHLDKHLWTPEAFERDFGECE